MRTLAIGDVHGCHTALLALLKQVKPAPDDQLIFLGDYIDRGPASRQVIESLLELKKSCSLIFLRGNHEVMILDAREITLKNNDWQGYDVLDALASYDANSRDDWISRIPKAHWDFLERTEKFFETQTNIFVHACALPNREMPDQPDEVLYWDSFAKIEPHESGKRIVCGHTAQRSGKPSDRGFAICIDTGAAYGGWLTCLDVNSGAYWQADEKGNTRADKL